MRQEKDDGTAQFHTRATFCPVLGVSGSGVSLHVYGDGSLFLRHFCGKLVIASNGGPDPWDTTNSWADDVTWTPMPGWTSPL